MTRMNVLKVQRVGNLFRLHNNNNIFTKQFSSDNKYPGDKSSKIKSSKTDLTDITTSTQSREWPVEDKIQAIINESVYSSVKKLDLWADFQDNYFDRRIIHKLNYSQYKYVKSVLHNTTVSFVIGGNIYKVNSLMDVQFIAKHGWDEYVSMMKSYDNCPTKAEDWPCIPSTNREALQATYETVDKLKLWTEFSSINFENIYADQLFKESGYFNNIMTHPNLKKYSDCVKLDCLKIVKYVHHTGWKQFCYCFRDYFLKQ